jgi:hypothetical protein
MPGSDALGGTGSNRPGFLYQFTSAILLDVACALGKVVKRDDVFELCRAEAWRERRLGESG